VAHKITEAEYYARHTPGVLDAVRNRCVGIAGAGGLGSNAAMLLARLGVGTLIIADFDVIEPSNLNRQNYRVDQVGQQKVFAAAETLRAINPFIEIIPHDIRLTRETFYDTFKDCDVVLECFDTRDAKRMAFAVARTTMQSVPFVMVSGIAGLGGEPFIERRIAPNVILIGDETPVDSADGGLISPRVMAAAAAQANLALRLLTEKK
jgi:sulfur carrier protein ThiS adenylyltransferase